MDIGMAFIIHDIDMYNKNKLEIVKYMEKSADEGDVCTAYIVKQREMFFLFIEGNDSLMDWIEIIVNKDAVKEVIIDKNSFVFKFFNLTTADAEEKIVKYYEEGIFRKATRTNCFDVLSLDDYDKTYIVFNIEDIEDFVEDLLETVNEKDTVGDLEFIEQIV